ncbi:putative ankyrin-containing lipoprotein Lxx09580 [Schistocerca piceifrons]|uniref:putative ankyrin-containing lipoprotein Lxx09580 n=1 Tax=Schistocerca piceifrons TaxID=274613 RepID=UPI001F5E63E7|nr:putative ankyrin-containing lipoprotein Lxx09580 [Schistocerca piceifrons]
MSPVPAPRTLSSAGPLDARVPLAANTGTLCPASVVGRGGAGCPLPQCGARLLLRWRAATVPQLSDQQAERKPQFHYLFPTFGSAPASADGSGPQGDRGRTPATAAPPTAARTTPPPDDSAVSRLRTLPEKEKNSRLIQAAKGGAVTELQTLLGAGADVGARDEGESRWTTLHWAADKGHEKAVRCLVEGGADMNARTSGWQETPLHRAAYSGHEAVARFLLEAGAEVDARNKTQSTPLLLAAEKGHAAVVRLLLASTPYHSARNQWGRTPLHEVALNGHAEAASALLEAGADRWARNNEGNTPLDLARQKNHQQLIDMLK